MATLFHHPLCPHSRFVRLLLGEFGIDATLVEERAFERRTEFLIMNPAGTTPVFQEEQSGAIPGAAVIAEYLDETRGLAMGDRRLLPGDPMGRVEVRRLVDWFNGKMYDEVTGYLVKEKVFKRFMPAELGGGAPDMAAIRAARSNIRYHLAYIGFLMQGRNWLAGDRLSWADLAAAAQLSAADYLGDVPWNENEAAKHWYARVKSRPSFRPLLADRVLGMEPSEHYADLDF
ncbi:glutathione S-transferase [Alsobacter soli]|uniref:Glutathione S-transferase n=1 Tax=Alsobacter soli TaxID=2109933 RepID=A0A2T1HNU3_9HYPH|nr:glutathione S-transferase family protein [Alsobacter soli]PSC03318.1 glutathione S-transferase [Alsobacter soli]